MNLPINVNQKENKKLETVEEAKLYEVGKTDECIWFKPSEVRDMIDDGYLREIPEAEYNDISFLLEETYVKFFTTAVDVKWESPIMQSFRYKVIRARGALTAFGKYKRSRPVWRDMCDRFYPQQNRVIFPEEMIEHLYELNTNEIIALLWYAVIYRDRWCGGAYEEYANNGLIGKVLTRLQELPHKVCLDDIIN